MDDDGYFYIVDRKKEMIKVNGLQVWPREVEEVIAQHNAVKEVAAAGVPHEVRGETVKAWVVLRPEAALTLQELQVFCSTYLANYKIPTEMEIRLELPRTTVGKLLRRELQRQHREA
jgi:long-chain acyl-CoA synthetase